MRSILLVPALILSAYASDWSRWRGPDANGISAESDWRPQALAAAPRLKWKTNLGVGHSSVSIAGKRLYTMGNVGGSDTVYCFDAETGKLAWRFPYACPPGNFSGPRATPTLDGGLLYTLSRKGDALCLDAETGKPKWAKDLIREFKAQPTDYGLCGSPLIVGELVIYNALDCGVALNKMTGEKIWASAEGAGGYATPVFFKGPAGDRVAIFGAKSLNVVDPASGKKLQSHPWTTQFDVNAADPAFFDEKLFITSAWERGCALLDVSGGSAKVLWENKNLRGHLASPIYLDGCLYGITATGGNHGNGVAYSVSVPMASALSLSQSGSQIDLNFTSVSGQSYQVERISDLRSSQWINLGNSIVATNGSLSVTDMAGGPGARFYRVITLP